MSKYKVEELNQAIAFPSDWIKSNDGREFLIREWAPKVKTGSVVEINIVVVVKMPDGSIAST